MTSKKWSNNIQECTGIDLLLRIHLVWKKLSWFTKGISQVH